MPLITDWELVHIAFNQISFNETAFSRWESEPAKNNFNSGHLLYLNSD
jgi:hypothetical protein